MATDTEELQVYFAKRLKSLNTSYTEVIVERNAALTLLTHTRRTLRDLPRDAHYEPVVELVGEIDKLLSESSWLEAKVAVRDSRPE